jgi:hypothetical protein
VAAAQPLCSAAANQGEAALVTAVELFQQEVDEVRHEAQKA